MKAGDAEYDALVRKLTESKMHKVTQLSEAETAKEIAEIQGGAKSSFEEAKSIFEQALFAPGIIKKRRGRPKGSKNKPKV